MAKKKKFGSMQIVGVLVILIGLSLSIYGTGIFEKSVTGSSLEEVKVLEDGTLEISHEQSQSFILSPTGKSVPCQVDDTKWAGCDTKDGRTTYGIDVELLAKNVANPSESYIYGAFQSCSGFMFNRCGYTPSQCELINGGKCGGSSSTTPLLECLSSSDCKKQPNGFCNAGKCDYSVVACQEGQFHCLGNGQIWKCSNQKLVSVGNCNYVYGIQACNGQTRYSTSQYEICAQSCVEGTSAGCPNSGDVCVQGTCTSQQAKDEITKLESAKLKAKERVCIESNGLWNKENQVCTEQLEQVRQTITPEGVATVGIPQEGFECDVPAVITCGNNEQVTTFNCVEGKYVDTGNRCSLATGLPVQLECKKYQVVNVKGTCSAQFSKVFTPIGFGDFFLAYWSLMIGIFLIITGAITYIWR